MRTLPSLLLCAGLALAPGAQANDSPATTAEAVPGRVTLSFRGPLQVVLRDIAKQGGISLVVLDGLDTSREVEVHLQGVPGPAALRTVARAYGLDVDEDEGVWTVRADGEAHAAPEAPLPPAPPVPPLPAVAPVPPLPPVPPVPPAPPVVRERAGRVEVRGRNHTVAEDEVVEEAVVLGGNLTVDGKVEQDAVAMGGNLTVNGHVEEDAVAMGGNLRINGRVEGDAHAVGGNVELGPNAVVDGDVSAFGGTVKRDQGARVGGTKATFAAPQSRSEEREESGGFAEWLGSLIIRFALLFALGFGFLMFAPARVKQVAQELRSAPGACGLTGVLAALALVPLTVLLCVTVVGIPVALALWPLGALGVALGVTALAGELGLRLPVLRGRKTQAIVLALGLGTLLLLGSLPVVGTLGLVAVCFMALGAVVRTRFGGLPRAGSSTVPPVAAPL